jgi:hypothetical protein
MWVLGIAADKEREAGEWLTTATTKVIARILAPRHGAGCPRAT